MGHCLLSNAHRHIQLSHAQSHSCILLLGMCVCLLAAVQAVKRQQVQQQLAAERDKMDDPECADEGEAALEDYHSLFVLDGARRRWWWCVGHVLLRCLSARRAGMVWMGIDGLRCRPSVVQS